MLKNFLIPTIVAAALAVPAFAQDATGGASAAIGCGSTFTRPRAEIFGGYVHTQSRFRGGPGAALTGNSGRSAATAGGELGYDLPIGDRFVAGPLGSFSLTTIPGGSCVGTASACIRPEMDWSAGGRFGAKMGENVLLYAKGAYVQTRIGSRQQVDTTMISSNDWRKGWRAGVGAEYAIAPHAYVKAEYDFTRTNRIGLGQQGFADTSLRLNRQAALAGFGVRF